MKNDLTKENARNRKLVGVGYNCFLAGMSKEEIEGSIQDHDNKQEGEWMIQGYECAERNAMRNLDTEKADKDTEWVITNHLDSCKTIDEIKEFISEHLLRNIIKEAIDDTPF